MKSTHPSSPCSPHGHARTPYENCHSRRLPGHGRSARLLRPHPPPRRDALPRARQLVRAAGRAAARRRGDRRDPRAGDLRARPARTAAKTPPAGAGRPGRLDHRFSGLHRARDSGLHRQEQLGDGARRAHARPHAGGAPQHRAPGRGHEKRRLGGHTRAAPPAELTLALMLAARRNIAREAERMKRGDWPCTLSHRLRGSTLGIFGLGAIGSLVAEAGSRLGLKILTFGRDKTAEKARAAGYAVAASKTELFENSDVLSLHVRLTAETRAIVA